MNVLQLELKTITFTRSDGVNVSLLVDLKSATNLNEDFLVLSIYNINTPVEIKLFYWLDKKRWTLNELRFFALNNNLCMKIFDKTNTSLASYGICGNQLGIFDKQFGINFN